MRALAGSFVVAATLAWAPAVRADVTRAQCVETYEKAQILRRDNKLRAAREALLVCSQKSCPSVTIGDCARWLSEVEALQPTISIAVRDAKGADLEATITVDGAPLASLAAGQTLPVDPGSHHAHAATRDGRSADLEFVARAGEQNRLVTLAIDDQAPAVVPPAPSAAPITVPEREKPATSTAPSIVPPVAVTAVGVLGVAAAIGFGLHASSEVDQVRARCAPSCVASSLDGVHSSLLFSDIGLGVGVVGLAVGTYLWIRYVTHHGPAEATAVAGHITGGPGGAAISF